MENKLKNIQTFEQHTDKNLNITLQEVMNDFYDEYESSYIDRNTHGVIVKLIEELKRNGLLLGGNWECM